METIDQIYQKVVEMELPPGAHAEVNELIATALHVGATWALPADPLAGYSNLTAAIGAGEPIDWGRLDGLKVQCVNPDIDTLRGKLVRDDVWPADSASGWVVHGMGITDITAWHGDNGWTLWVEGEIPLRRKTADQLEVGTYFLGKLGGRSIDFMYVGRPIDFEGKTVHYTPGMEESTATASEWEVLEEYGTFQKPEGK